MTESEKRFDAYIKRFCAMHNISEEEAQKNLIVQEYKRWGIKECNE